MNKFKYHLYKDYLHQIRQSYKEKSINVKIMKKCIFTIFLKTNVGQAKIQTSFNHRSTNIIHTIFQNCGIVTF